MILLAVDGNSILNRAYYGVKPLTTKDGMFTQAIYGFLNMLEKMKNDVEPDRVAIAFDLKAPTFRHEMYDQYKANRKGMPQELYMQLGPLKELLTYLGYTLVTCEGYEADDILGTLSKACSDSDNDCVIASGDRDTLQLVNDHVKVRMSKNNDAVLYDTEKIKEQYGVTPKQLIEIKAIQGDSSDNIPGVPGIGEKGARDLIQNYGSVEYIYDHLDEITLTKSQRKKLEEGKESCFMSRKLGEICLSAPVDTNLDSYIVKDADTDSASKLMTRLELFRLMEKMGITPGADTVQTGNRKESRTITKREAGSAEFSSLLSELESINIYVVWDKGDFVSFLFAYGDEVIEVKDRDCFDLLLKSGIKKYAYDSKALFSYADKEKFEIRNLFFDVTLAAYLLSPSSSDYDLSRLVAEYDIDVPLYEGDDDKLIPYVFSMKELSNVLENRIKELQMDSLLYDIEIPLANVLARMENIGFKVDVEGIKEYGEMIGRELENIEQEIYSYIGREININSPKQLGVALFEDLNLPVIKKTKTGYSTSAEVLEELRNRHPVIEKILQYRTYAKLKSTYCDSLLEKVHEDGRIHSSFNQKETRTGRISSTEPNLQNIPVRTELGRELRRFFIADEGCVLVDADYSQIELRVLAHIADDGQMKKAFNDNVDIHTVTASEVFNMPVNMVTPQMRSSAKAVNFGIVYGIGAFSLSKDINVTVKEANEYIKSYLEHFSGIDRYMKSTIEKAKTQGYVETLFNRRRYIPELSASNFVTRSFGERVARNAPIQGTAADIIKIAMIKVDKRLKDEGLEARLVLQVHDELIVEAQQYEMMQVMMILQEEMENAVKLSVPLVAEAACGSTWYEAKG